MNVGMIMLDLRVACGTGRRIMMDLRVACGTGHREDNVGPQISL